jgi:hypothetical protein
MQRLVARLVAAIVLLVFSVSFLAAAAPAPGSSPEGKVTPPPASPKEAFTGETLELPAQTIAPGKASLTLSLKFPEGYKLNLEAPSPATVTSSDQKTLSLDQTGRKTISQPRYPLNLLLKASPGQALLQIDLALNYCKSGREGLCLSKEVRLLLPVTVAPGTTNKQLQVSYQVKL